MANNGDSYNKGGLIAFLLSVSFCIVFFFYISFIHPGVDLKEVSEEAQAAGATATAFKIGDVKEPWVENADVAKYGKKVFDNNCAACHGKEGKGDGVATVPPPRNFVEGKWKNGGKSQDLYQTILVGSPGTTMASFKHLSKSDRWAVVQFIRSITQNKVADDAAALADYAAKAE